jgi:hypothetical protein
MGIGVFVHSTMENGRGNERMKYYFMTPAVTLNGIWLIHEKESTYLVKVAN